MAFQRPFGTDRPYAPVSCSFNTRASLSAVAMRISRSPDRNRAITICEMPDSLAIWYTDRPLSAIAEILPGDDLAGILRGAVMSAGVTPQRFDVLVITQKIISKAEDRFVERKQDPAGDGRARHHRHRDAIQADAAGLHHGQRVIILGQGQQQVFEGRQFLAARSGQRKRAV